MYLKKYLTEGLIQVAIMLSLCGMRVDVGLEPYLPQPLHEMMLGPSAGITQTQFHNLWNRLDDGHHSHPKNIDLDGFFTSRRLLGWVRSLDRFQVPNAELETWLVHREPDMLPGERRGQPTPLERAPGGVLDESPGPLSEWSQSPGPLSEGSQSPAWAGRSRQEEAHRQVSLSLQECLRLLEHTFPFAHQPSEETSPAIGGAVDHESLPAGERGPLPSPLIPSEQPPLDLELQWQDLLAIMEPQGLDDGTPFPSSQDTDGFSGAIQNPLDASILSNYPSSSNGHNDNPMIYQDVHLMEAALPPETLLLPLTPSTELDQHSMRLNASEALENMDVNNSRSSTPYPSNMLSGDPSENLNMGLDVENGYTTFDMNPLTQEPADDFASDTNTGPHSLGALSSFDMDFCPNDLTSASATPQWSGTNANLPIIPPSHLLVDDEEDGDYGLPSPLGDLLEDAAILDEVSLLDLALEEGFSPEMAARLEEEGYLDPEPANRNAGQLDTNVPNTEEDHDGTSRWTMALRHQQGTSSILNQESEEKADSDSGLSLDCSFSPASPCGSESSCYSSSSTSSSSSSGTSTGSLYSEGNEQKDDDGGMGLDMELEVTIKQEEEEEEEEEEEGAVGGYYSSDVSKIGPTGYHEEKLFNGLPWQEHIGHDHTYNQAWPHTPTPATGKTAVRQSKYSSPQSRGKPYPRSSPGRFADAELWSRDDRRARSLKIPFSNELIVNLPVDDFNELLANHRLSEEQQNLVRDIRRRGKNKAAAQNCRRKKLGALLGLEEDVAGLRRRRALLRREKQEALKSLQEMERRLEGLYQEVMFSMRDEEGRPLAATDYALQFGANGSVTVTPRRHGALPRADGKAGKKHRDKKCE
ncbi:hypothetical protein NHX12_032295 [Muraenolepis orangiensis]|uniref:Endoplasmic reticulum membrane sensor NFE2L1 n=1 Tax=Muraenolepis orangiensis TaxID=630683 RepID=A0A9Q0E5G7_9TELE|nr:hypothetical protein NHX12_032295 [Muraenolepis orangiensis]